MLHIAICDDDPAAVQTHREITEQSLRQCQCAGEISIYTHSDNLLYDITQDHFFFDLILLDIEMPGCTGMEMAEQIRPHLPQGKIIFITSHVEYAIDAFALSIFRYVPKAELAQRLPAALRDAIALITLEDGKTYTIQTSSRLENSPTGRSISLNGTEKMPASPRPAGCPRFGKASSRSTRSWGRRSFSTSTGAVS